MTPPLAALIRKRRPTGRGQSLVEFALVLPLLLTLFGGALDVARVFNAWITLEAATRDAAEYAATSDTTASAATSDAQRIICTQAAALPGFDAPPGNPSGCHAPDVTVTSFSISTTAPGASSKYPIATVTVRATLPFRTLFAYPLFTQNGAWTLTSVQTFAVVQGR